MQSSLESVDSVAQIRSLTIRYLERWSAEECPTCQTRIPHVELLDRINLSTDAIQDRDAFLSELDELNSKIEYLKSLYARKTELNEEFSKIPDRIESTYSNFEGVSKLPSDLEGSIVEIDQTIIESNEKIEELETSLSEQTRSTSLELELERLKKESRYHQLRSRRERLTVTRDQTLSQSEIMIKNVDSQIKSIRRIREVLLEGFNSALDSSIPDIENRTTKVYQQLTQQKSFDQVRIAKGDMSPSGPKLSLRVESSMEPGHLQDPEQVLNGQAKSATRLIPYFVFSSLDKDSRELDFLLIDDPSQSFDTKHIDLLVELLKGATDHAQLVVATHEEAQFAPLIKKQFSDMEINVIKVMDFDLQAGPKLEMEPLVDSQ